MTELLGLAYSPWTEKARWALELRRVPYRFRRYQPVLGEPALRAKLGRLSGRVSVPVLTDDDGRATADSLAIARWADGRGEGASLFPEEHAAAIARWAELSERALAAGRALSLERMLADRDALAEMVPRAIRALLGPLAWRMGAFGVGRTYRKYGGDAAGAATHRAALVSALDELRAALASAPEATPRTLLGRLTFADVAMAQALVFVEPPKAGLELGSASRRSFSDPELARSYADLVAWRDALYQAHRGGGP